MYENKVCILINWIYNIFGIYFSYDRFINCCVKGIASSDADFKKNQSDKLELKRNTPLNMDYYIILDKYKDIASYSINSMNSSNEIQ